MKRAFLIITAVLVASATSCIKEENNINVFLKFKPNKKLFYRFKIHLNLTAQNPILSLSENITLSGKFYLKLLKKAGDKFYLKGVITEISYEADNPFVRSYLKKLIKTVKKKVTNFYIHKTGEVEIPFVYRNKGKIDKGFSKTANIVVPVFPEKALNEMSEWNRNFDIIGKSLGNWVYSQVHQHFKVKQIWNDLITIEDAYELHAFKAETNKKPKTLKQIGGSKGGGITEFNYITGEIVRRTFQFSFQQNSNLKYKALSTTVDLKGKVKADAELINPNS